MLVDVWRSCLLNNVDLQHLIPIMIDHFQRDLPSFGLRQIFFVQQ